MRILVLGGTAFLGRAIATEAIGRDHDVTCLARGSSEPPRGARFVRGDRDLDDGLSQVAATRWDAVVDVSRQPGQVRRAVRDLVADQLVLISTANVYATDGGIEPPEEAPRVPALEDDVMASMIDYGRAKVACEDAVADADTATTIIRPALIGGPVDTSGRSAYWPWRFAHPTGEDVLAPDDLDFPTAVVDVRDLAQWVVTVVEDRVLGVFNVAGETVTLGAILDEAATAADSTTPIRTVPVEVLATRGVTGWMGPCSFPLWIDDPSLRGFGTLDTRRARRHGFVTRPLVETFRDLLRDTPSDPQGAGLSDHEEVALRRHLDSSA